MKDAKKALASFYRIDSDDIGTVSVTSADEVNYSWNMMGKSSEGGYLAGYGSSPHGIGAARFKLWIGSMCTNRERESSLG